MKKKIIVTGGSGLLGKSLYDLIPQAQYLSSNDVDLRYFDAVDDLFDKERPDIVIHLAARVGGIKQNMQFPLEFIQENLLIDSNVLKAAHLYGVKKLIAVSSTCAYPAESKKYPFKEDQMLEGLPEKTNLGYAYAKRCLMLQIDALRTSYERKYCYIIPSNIFGEYENAVGDSRHYIASLLGKINEAICSYSDHISLFGSGKPLRQFIYARDVARVITLMIKNGLYENFNVTPPWNLSITKMAQIALKTLGLEKKIKILYEEGPDGVFRKDASNKKMISLFPNFIFTQFGYAIKKTFMHMYNKAL